MKNWGIVLIGLLLVAGLIDILLNEKVAAKKWLLLAVTTAETEFGGKTGQLKLRYVYDMFVDKFSLLSKFITFDQFSEMVDEALVEMRHLLETNVAVYELVHYGIAPHKEE